MKTRKWLKVMFYHEAFPELQQLPLFYNPHLHPEWTNKLGGPFMANRLHLFSRFQLHEVPVLRPPPLRERNTQVDILISINIHKEDFHILTNTQARFLRLTWIYDSKLDIFKFRKESKVNDELHWELAEFVEAGIAEGDYISSRGSYAIFIPFPCSDIYSKRQFLQ